MLNKRIMTRLASSLRMLALAVICKVNQKGHCEDGEVRTPLPWLRSEQVAA